MPANRGAHARREQRGAAVRRVDVHPDAAVAADPRDAGEIVDEPGVGRARGGDDCADRAGIAVGFERRPRSAAPVRWSSTGGHDERVDVDDPHRVRDRRVRLVAHRDPQRAGSDRGRGAARARSRDHRAPTGWRPIRPARTRRPRSAGRPGELARGTAAPGSRRAPRPRPRSTRCPRATRTTRSCRTAATPSWARPG